jgi:hypothetical protein
VSYIGVQPTAGQYRKLDNISASFNGSTTSFTTSVGGTNVTAGTAQQLLVSVGGVIQEPNSDYTVSTNTITFTTAPASGLDFFAILMGDALNTVSASDGSITTAKLAGSLSVGLAAGTNSAPSLYFTGDSNTGIYSPGTDQVGITTGGSVRLTTSTTAFTGTLPWQGQNGTAAAPALSFSGDPNTGIYNVGADQLGISTNGTLRFDVSTTATTSTLPVVHPLGAVGTPSITFTGDLNTGIYSPAADTIAFVEGGVEAMRIANGGEVLVGTTSTASGGSGGNFAFIAQCFTNEENRPIAAFRRADLISAQFFGSNGGDGNAANCIMRIRGHSSGNRSINAGGSVNATGADYAEYMTKAGNFEIAKGDVCGVTADGKLTNVFTAAIGFVVKSTDPSYVGNDVWGIDIENDEQREAAREKVDRIAFAGQVPVNVTGATPGQYIVPVSTEDGGITGIAKDEGDLTLAEYMRAVGKVIATEDDGRARIIVKVA